MNLIAVAVMMLSVCQSGRRKSAREGAAICARRPTASARRIVSGKVINVTRRQRHVRQLRRQRRRGSRRVFTKDSAIPDTNKEMYAAKRASLRHNLGRQRPAADSRHTPAQDQGLDKLRPRGVPKAAATPKNNPTRFVSRLNILKLRRSRHPYRSDESTPAKPARDGTLAVSIPNSTLTSRGRRVESRRSAAVVEYSCPNGISPSRALRTQRQRGIDVGSFANPVGPVEQIHVTFPASNGRPPRFNSDGWRCAGARGRRRLKLGFTEEKRWRRRRPSDSHSEAPTGSPHAR